MPWTTLCVLDELTEGEAKAVDIDGYRLAVFLHHGQPHVLHDVCPHAGAPMSGGWIQDGCAVCPRHLWRFDLSDGKISGTGGDGLQVYITRTIEFNGRTLVQAELAMP
ncbi:MAG: nagAb 2 [Phycisphaerales bacterium]|nr:nagAb 2 [Phycisphaerales bacterium]